MHPSPQHPLKLTWCIVYHGHAGPSEIAGGCIEAMGLSAADVQSIAENWQETMNMVLAKIVSMHGYSWQLMQDMGEFDSLSTPRTASFFREECAANSKWRNIYIHGESPRCL